MSVDSLMGGDVGRFYRDVADVLEDMDRVAKIIISKAVRNGDYELNGHDRLVLGEREILENTVHFPTVQEFRPTLTDSPTLFIHTRDHKKDISIDGDRQRFPNDLGGCQISAIIYISEDDINVELTVLASPAQYDNNVETEAKE